MFIQSSLVHAKQKWQTAIPRLVASIQILQIQEDSNWQQTKDTY